LVLFLKAKAGVKQVRTLSFGKYHRLQNCSSLQRTFTVLAIDHRTSLLKAMAKQQKVVESAGLLGNFKLDIVRYLGAVADSVLLDPEIGAPLCISEGIPKYNTGMIISLEKSGYSGNPTSRENALLTGWDVQKSVRMGADAVKLLVYYHPDEKNKAITEDLILQVARDCDVHEIPFFLEPLTYSLNPKFDKIPGEDRKIIIIETARRLSSLGADVLKMEFPVDIETNKDRTYWAMACSELTEASLCPWILLSASVDFDTYFDQVSIACQQGSSGIAVGRAVWKEAISLKSQYRRKEFLTNAAYERMEKLSSLCQKTARPWTSYFSAPEINVKWHENY
jgi:tagatose 1,6-diphosphate aldolase